MFRSTLFSCAAVGLSARPFLNESDAMGHRHVRRDGHNGIILLGSRHRTVPTQNLKVGLWRIVPGETNSNTWHRQGGRKTASDKQKSIGQNQSWVLRIMTWPSSVAGQVATLRRFGPPNWA